MGEAKRTKAAAEHEAACLREAGDILAESVRDFLNVLEADGAECTCEDWDTCPKCRAELALFAWQGTPREEGP